LDLIEWLAPVVHKLSESSKQAAELHCLNRTKKISRLIDRNSARNNNYPSIPCQVFGPWMTQASEIPMQQVRAQINFSTTNPSSA
jgi:hypothetical protein